MPLVTVTMRVGRDPREKDAILGAVHEALVYAFKIPDHDRTQRVIELSEDHFEISNTRSSRFMVIEIDAFPGRSLDAKRALYARIGENLAALGENDFWAILREPDLENWCVRQAKPATDIELGFALKV